MIITVRIEQMLSIYSFELEQNSLTLSHLFILSIFIIFERSLRSSEHCFHFPPNWSYGSFGV